MLDVFFGVLAALAVKEVYFEVLGWYRRWQWQKERKDFEVFVEHLEDIDADDEDEE